MPCAARVGSLLLESLIYIVSFTIGWSFLGAGYNATLREETLSGALCYVAGAVILLCVIPVYGYIRLRKASSSQLCFPAFVAGYGAVLCFGAALWSHYVGSGLGVVIAIALGVVGLVSFVVIDSRHRDMPWYVLPAGALYGGGMCFLAYHVVPRSLPWGVLAILATLALYALLLVHVGRVGIERGRRQREMAHLDSDTAESKIDG